MAQASTAPADAGTVSVAWVRDIGGQLVEVMFGLPDQTRRRVVLRRGDATVDKVSWVARALVVLQAMQSVPR